MYRRNIVFDKRSFITAVRKPYGYRALVGRQSFALINVNKRNTAAKVDLLLSNGVADGRECDSALCDKRDIANDRREFCQWPIRCGNGSGIEHAVNSIPQQKQAV